MALSFHMVAIKLCYLGDKMGNFFPFVRDISVLEGYEPDPTGTYTKHLPKGKFKLYIINNTKTHDDKHLIDDSLRKIKNTLVSQIINHIVINKRGLCKRKPVINFKKADWMDIEYYFDVLPEFRLYIDHEIFVLHPIKELEKIKYAVKIATKEDMLRRVNMASLTKPHHYYTGILATS